MRVTQKAIRIGMLLLCLVVASQAHAELFAFCTAHNNVAWWGSDTVFRVSSQSVLDAEAAPAFLKQVRQDYTTLPEFLKHGTWEQATVTCPAFASREEARASQKQAGPAAGKIYKHVGMDGLVVHRPEGAAMIPFLSSAKRLLPLPILLAASTAYAHGQDPKDPNECISKSSRTDSHGLRLYNVRNDCQSRVIVVYVSLHPKLGDARSGNAYLMHDESHETYLNADSGIAFYACYYPHVPRDSDGKMPSKPIDTYVCK